MSNALTGEDVFQINGRTLREIADGDPVKITFEEDKAVVKRGKNGNVIYGKNEKGGSATVELRLIRGGADDKFLNGLTIEQDNDMSAFTLMTGFFVKRSGDGSGKITDDVYHCKGGVFKRNVDAKTSAEGDTEQSVAIYAIHFGEVKRSLQ